MSLITLFAKKSPSTEVGAGNRNDTLIFKDKECTQLFARWPWHQSGCPRKNSTRVTLNCFQWNLEWV